MPPVAGPLEGQVAGPLEGQVAGPLEGQVVGPLEGCRCTMCKQDATTTSHKHKKTPVSQLLRYSNVDHSCLDQ